MTSKILLVDDEPMIVDSMKTYLECLDTLDINTASNGLEALDKCQDHKFDLIILDFSMPKMNGGEFLKTIRNTENINKETNVLMLSGYIEEAIKEVKDEKTEFMDKPPSFDKIEAIIKSL